MQKIQQASELYEYLVKHDLLNSKGNLINVRNKHPLYTETKRLIFKFTQELPSDTTVAIRMRYIKEGMTPLDNICPIDGCSNQRKFSAKNRTFQTICELRDPEHLKYREITRVQKIIDTSIKLHGGRCSLHSDPEVSAKRDATWESRGGNPMTRPDIIKKAQDVQKSRNGGVLAFNTPSAKINSKNAVAEFHKKRKENIFVPGSFGRNTSINTNNYKKISEEYIRENFMHNGFAKIKEIESFLGCSQFLAYDLFKRYNIEFKSRRGESTPEIELKEFIRGLIPDIEIQSNTRRVIPPKEIDIYLPEYKLAIEFNGLMYHSQGLSKYKMFNTPDFDKYYHKKKTDNCLEKGITLLHIFENEWLDPNKREIWLSIIRNKLRANQNRIGSRKCSIHDVENKEALEFLSLNHIQGQIGSSIKYGLYYNKELVALMTFGKNRFRNGYELIRFCVKKNYTVHGAASKLLNHFAKNYSVDIYSYANRRWSNGNLYKKLGFELVDNNTIQPNFFYFNPRTLVLEARQQFQKHKLADKLEVFDDKLTAHENVLINGYRILFDSGNLTYKKSQT